MKISSRILSSFIGTAMYVPKREHFDQPKSTYAPNMRSNDLQTSDCEIEFQTQHHIADHCLGSPPRWTRRPSRSTAKGAFHSKPLPDRYSSPSPSPTRRLQVIKESRISLMRMVEDMPESSYELSLRDMVDDQRSMEEEQQKVVKEDRSKSNLNSTMKRKYNKKSQIPRSESVDSGVFLLKMFVPTSLSFKKDSKEKTCPKASPCPKASTKPFPVKSENQNGLRRSTSDISWSTQRPFTSYFRASSWSTNRKPRQRGCLF